MRSDLLPATVNANASDEVGYWLTPVTPHGDRWGFELLDGEQKPIVQFLYEDEVAATTARVTLADATWGAAIILRAGDMLA